MRRVARPGLCRSSVVLQHGLPGSLSIYKRTESEHYSGESQQVRCEIQNGLHSCGAKGRRFDSFIHAREEFENFKIRASELFKKEIFWRYQQVEKPSARARLWSHQTMPQLVDLRASMRLQDRCPCDLP
jgi:hypothetical protein